MSKINFLIKIYQNVNHYINYLFANQTSEKSLFKYLSGKKVIFFDVGSNLGLDIDNILKIYLKKKEIHAFEPHSKNYFYLKNKYKTSEVFINQSFIDKKKTTVKFYERTISSLSSAIKNDDKYIKKRSIKTETIDNYCEVNNIDRIHFLKIDTEGYDLNVLKSAKIKLKKKKIDLIKIEIIFSKNKKELSFHKNVKFDDKVFKDIYDFLNSYGYKFCGFSNQKFKNGKLFLMDAFFTSKNIS